MTHDTKHETVLAYLLRQGASGARLVRMPGMVPLYALQDGLATQMGDCAFVARETFTRAKGHVLEDVRGARIEPEDHHALAEWMARESSSGCGRISPCKS
jgi:hypothetical protein